MTVRQQDSGGAQFALGRDESAMRARVGMFGFFALGFGCIVGSGWVVLLGEWLSRAGPFGSAGALLAGAAIMILVGLAYGELSSRLPQAGADYIYARAAFGPRFGFLVGWFVLLFLLLVVSFEGIVLAWIAETVAPVVRGATLYSLVGSEVTVDALVIGLGGVVAIMALNLRGVGSAVRFQALVTILFLVVGCGALAAAALFGGQKGVPALLASTAPPITGFLWVFSTCALFYNGFQAIPQVVEDRDPSISPKRMAGAIAVSIGASGLFYLVVILCATVAAPWPEIVDAKLPTAAAVDRALPGLGAVLLLAAAVSVVKTWNAVFLTAVQTIVALARDGVLPAHWANPDRRGAYRRAILFVAACNAGGVLLGRGAISPLIDMASVSIGFVIASCVAAAFRLRRREGQAPAPIPGGSAALAPAFLGTAAMALAAMADLVLRPGFPVGPIAMVSWAAAGIAFYGGGRTRRHGAVPA